MDEGNDEICKVCDKHIQQKDKTRTIKGETLLRYADASIERMDNKEDVFRNADALKVHEACAKQYTSKLVINVRLNNLNIPQPSTSTQKNTRRSGGTFDFKKLCFFCEIDASDDFISKQTRKDKNSRVSITLVSKADTLRTSIVSAKPKAFLPYVKKVVDRVLTVDDLNSVGARYHRSCHTYFNKQLKKCDELVPESPHFLAAMFVNQHMLNNPDECQFSIQSILKDYEGPPYVISNVKDQLLQIQPKIVLHASNKESIVTLKSVHEKVLTDYFYETRKKSADVDDERMRIVKTAGKVIKEDIRGKIYETDYYPAPDNFFEKIETDIPETLRVLLDEIIVKDKKKTENTKNTYTNKVISIAHNIIAACRPRSFISCLQVALSGFMWRRFGSKNLIRVLSSLGLCASYDEAELLESSVIAARASPKLSEGTLMQIVADNADHNTRTVDGKNSMHIMGVIMCATPSNKVSSIGAVTRLKEPLGSKEIIKLGKKTLNLQCKKPKIPPLKSVKLDNLNVKYPIDYKIQLPPLDFLWIVGKCETNFNYPGWYGYMKKVYSKKNVEKSRIIYLPFINNPPSDYETVYTTMLQADEERKKQGVNKHVFITFDQPLYYKAREIKRMFPDLFKFVHIRLGGFHLLLSFLGCIGFVMKASGLKDLITTIFAATSAEHIINGKYYARAVRAHLLISLALYHDIYQSFTISVKEKQILKNLINSQHILDETTIPEFQTIYKKFLKHTESIKSNGPTAKLWVTYLEMCTILRLFIVSERTGNWELQLDCIRKMLPFFFACGHFNYAKSVLIYLQDMMNLKESLSEDDYEMFVKKGYFTIKRSDSFFCGTFTDMVIEQEFMKNLKKTGEGLTHGQHVTEESLSGWILSMPYFVDIIKLVQNFTGVQFTSTEQHVDASDARIKRDKEDLEKLLKFLEEHNPFEKSMSLMCIITGSTGNTNINCHNAFEIGMQLVDDAYKQTEFGNIKYERKKRIVSLQSLHSVQVKQGSIEINPTLLFQRIASAVETKDLKSYLKYELSPWPESIFENNNFRKSAKSDLYKLFISIDKPQLETCLFIIDGGFLLHKVVWPPCRTFSKIFNAYLDYVMKFKEMGKKVKVIFDGYESSGTKDAERRLRESNKTISIDVEVNHNKICPSTQDKFLLNKRNKSKLVKKITEFFSTAGIDTVMAEEDADALIVHTAVQDCTDDSPTVIVGQDTDLIILLTQLTNEKSNTFFWKIDSTDSTWYNADSFIHKPLRHVIALLHCFCGCDTTSAFYFLGKTKIFDRFSLDDKHPAGKHPQLLQELVKFYDKSAKQDEIIAVGNELIMYLYSNKKNPDGISLNALRYTNYKTNVRKKSFKIAKLPPTESAAAQHSLRVYYQIVKWVYPDIQINPTSWGWESSDGQLYPRKIKPGDALVPIEILKNISCTCKINSCLRSCGCAKNGMKCSEYCKNCVGKNCNNSERCDDDMSESDVEAVDESSDHEKNDNSEDESADDENNDTVDEESSNQQTLWTDDDTTDEECEAESDGDTEAEYDSNNSGSENYVPLAKKSRR